VELLPETDVRESRFLVAGGGRGELVGTLLDLILEAYDAMTQRQRQIVDLVKTSDTQQQVATHLGISRQAVNQSLTAAGWPHIERAETVVRSEFRALWNHPEPG
jgi:DNA-binding phage protein